MGIGSAGKMQEGVFLQQKMGNFGQELLEGQGKKLSHCSEASRFYDGLHGKRLPTWNGCVSGPNHDKRNEPPRLRSGRYSQNKLL